MLPYWAHLIWISIAFMVLERLFPWRRQALLRPGWITDLIYLVFNGHFLSLLMAPVALWLASRIDGLVVPLAGRAHLAGWAPWAQFLVAFFVIDFMQWCVHNLLHRVPWLWPFHKVHHSITTMDWAGSMRFHWLEVVVYKSLQYLPLLLLGFDARVLFFLALFSTAMGHFNHSNMSVPMGPLRYLFNHPTMHIWHHDHTLHLRAGCNFGINLSLWDWLFGTADMPADTEQPQRLGFDGIEGFPAQVLSQQLVPLTLFGVGKKSRP